MSGLLIEHIKAANIHAGASHNVGRAGLNSRRQTMTQPPAAKRVGRQEPSLFNSGKVTVESYPEALRSSGVIARCCGY